MTQSISPSSRYLTGVIFPICMASVFFALFFPSEIADLSPSFIFCERTAISEGKIQRKERKEHREIQRYGDTPICQRSNRIYTADFKTP